MNPIAPDIQAEIKRQLIQLERDHGIAILYACESGSRAWGFESTDSDYDVRFLYVRPSDWYVSIDLESRRDVVELPIDDVLDINGWDIRKALQLFRKTNPPLIEWLFSPIVYRETGWLADRMRQLAPEIYNFTSARYHYYHMADRNFREYLRGDSVIRKKYLYVLRPLLAVNWIEKGLGIVPTEFDRLVSETVSDVGLTAEIAELLRLKRSGNELDLGAPFPAIQTFVESELERHSNESKIHSQPKSDFETLNQIFRDVVREFGS